MSDAPVPPVLCARPQGERLWKAESQRTEEGLALRSGRKAETPLRRKRKKECVPHL